MPLKQAVISASALSLLYPQAGIEAHSRERFLDDLVSEAETEINECLRKGAHNVQIDFTEARLSVKFDPSKRKPTSRKRLIAFDHVRMRWEQPKCAEDALLV